MRGLRRGLAVSLTCLLVAAGCGGESDSGTAATRETVDAPTTTSTPSPTSQAESLVDSSARQHAIEDVPVATLTGHTDAVTGLAFSPDGTQLASASWDGTAKLWDLATTTELATFAGHTDAVWGVAFSPDGTQLASASWDGTAKLWDLATATELATLSGESAPVFNVAFSPDGTQLATAGGDGTAKLWDANSATEIATLDGHSDAVLDVAFSPDGTQLATAGGDGTAKLWDANSATEIATFMSRAEGVEVDSALEGVEGVAFSPDGTQLATASRDDTAKVWDLATAAGIATLSGDTVSWVFDVAFSPDGTQLATANLHRSEDGTIMLWALEF